MATRFDYLFIITYGRSGSTLLQGILNSIPGYCIRGENNGVLHYLRLTYQQTVVASKSYKAIAKTPADAWYGIADIDAEGLLTDMRDLFIKHYLRPPEGTRCMGFKEIRFAPKMIGKLYDFVQFMQLMFPNAGFVFNSRDIETTSKSDFWRERKDAKEFLEIIRGRMQFTFSKLDGNAFWLEYDEYVENPEILKGLFEFLDEPFDLEQVCEVMEKPHSAQPRPRKWQ